MSKEISNEFITRERPIKGITIE